jgi:hypothetical protein
MKGFITGLLKGRIIRWSGLAAILVAAGLSLAWEHHHYQLGGVFIGSGGTLWSGYNAPLDPDGRTAALRVNCIAYGADFAGLLTALNADTLGEAVGQEEMISRDTWKYSTVGYLTKQGTPPVVKAIYVMAGKGKFTSPNDTVINYEIDVYPVTDGVWGDGFPDGTPLPPITGTTTAQRVLP